MRKSNYSLLLVGLFIILSQSISAKIAKPGQIKHIQPDGSVVYIQKHGDEYSNWMTMNGTPVVVDNNGFIRNETAAESAKRKIASTAASVRKESRPQNVGTAPEGEFHHLVLLIEFPDLEFKTNDPKSSFTRMLNQNGYSNNGGTGSVRDYYIDNSNGNFKPEFDVYGPVMMSKSYTYYGKDNAEGWDENAQDALYEACLALDAQIDFSEYDHDNDGIVDNIFFFYAGESAAESTKKDIIWPHAYSLNNHLLRCDGVKIFDYACGSELKGTGINATMEGIGTFCHEFGHIIGLPDMYDTDYAENGTASTLGNYSLMDTGCYNNNGNTPPYLNCVEKCILGWMDEPIEWQTPGQKSIESIENNVAYYTPTSQDGEWFIYETRSGKNWDKYVNPGMLIYHIDRSKRTVGGKSALSRWNSGYGINCYGDHPCFTIKKASGYNYTFGVKSFTSFNGSTNPSTIDWNGIDSGFYLSDIHYNNGTTTLNLEIIKGFYIHGAVTDINGDPLKDVTISLEPIVSEVQSISNSQFKKARNISNVSKYSVKTDENGVYNFKVESLEEKDFLIVAYKEGYIRQSLQVSVNGKIAVADFILKKTFDTDRNSISKYGEVANYAYGFDESTDLDYMMAVRFSPTELKDYAGGQLKDISFLFYADSLEECYAIVDFGNKRELTLKIDNPVYGDFNTIDISKYNLTIPSNKNIYIGYAVKGLSGNYPIAVGEKVSDGGFCFADFSLKTSDWEEYEYEGVTISASVIPTTKPLTYFGFNMISNELSQYSDGTIFPLKLVTGDATVIESVTWFYDDNKTTSKSVTLKSGSHTVKAVISYFDGTTETLELKLNVK